jgi:hypothetical protein
MLVKILCESQHAQTRPGEKLTLTFAERIPDKTVLNLIYFDGYFENTDTGKRVNAGYSYLNYETLDLGIPEMDPGNYLIKLAFHEKTTGGLGTVYEFYTDVSIHVSGEYRVKTPTITAVNLAGSNTNVPKGVIDRNPLVIMGSDLDSIFNLTVIRPFRIMYHQTLKGSKAVKFMPVGTPSAVFRPGPVFIQIEYVAYTPDGMPSFRTLDVSGRLNFIE